MWQHNYMPLGDSLALSTPVAALPIVVLFVMLGVFRKPAWLSAVTALASALWTRSEELTGVRFAFDAAPPSGPSATTAARGPHA